MPWTGTPHEAVVRAAAEMISGQASCTHDEAIRLLMRRAVEVTRPVPDAARLVVEGVLRFDA